MNLKEVINSEKVDFTGLELSYFLLGLLSAFENRFQAVADSTMKEISWKQFFASICINLCKEEPTVKELSEIQVWSDKKVYISSQPFSVFQCLYNKRERKTLFEKDAGG